MVLRSQNGFTLISILMAGVAGILVLLAMGRGIAIQGYAERGLASNMDLSEVAYHVSLMTRDAAVCANSTLIGVDTTPLFAVPPVPVEISLSLGGNPPIVAAGQLVGSRNIESFQITSMTLAAAAASDYLANLRVTTSVSGKAMTSRLPTKDFAVSVTINPATKVITACGIGTAPSTGLKGVEIAYREGAATQVTVTLPIGTTLVRMTSAATFGAPATPGWVDSEDWMKLDAVINIPGATSSGIFAYGYGMDDYDQNVSYPWKDRPFGGTVYMGIGHPKAAIPSPIFSYNSGTRVLTVSNLWRGWAYSGFTDVNYHSFLFECY